MTSSTAIVHAIAAFSPKTALATPSPKPITFHNGRRAVGLVSFSTKSLLNVSRCSCSWSFICCIVGPTGVFFSIANCPS